MGRSKHGGRRPNAGRKSELTEPERLMVVVERLQLQALDRWKAEQLLASRSAAIRRLIDRCLIGPRGPQ